MIAKINLVSNTSFGNKFFSCMKRIFFISYPYLVVKKLAITSSSYSSLYPSFIPSLPFFSLVIPSPLLPSPNSYYNYPLVTSLASPRSHIFTARVFASTSMFSGFMSLWKYPLLCKASSPSAT